MSPHPVVSHEQWLEARMRLLAREKTFTRERDTLSQERRDLPWEKVNKEYIFDGPREDRAAPGSMYRARG